MIYILAPFPARPPARKKWTTGLMILESLSISRILSVAVPQKPVTQV